MAKFNPFERSKMKIEEPLQLLSQEMNYDGSCELTYRATRSAAQVGLLAKQFKVGTPLVANGRHVVIRSVTLTHTSGTVDQVTIRVEAVDFEHVLAAATGRTQKHIPVKSPMTPIRPQGRRILL